MKSTYKSPWVYRATWRAGDEFIGRRWAVINISHSIIVRECVTEKEAKQAARDLRKYHAEARKAANRAAKGYPRIREPNKKQREWLAAKLAAQSFTCIPFPSEQRNSDDSAAKAGSAREKVGVAPIIRARGNRAFKARSRRSQAAT